MSSRVPLIFGTMTIGAAGTYGARNHGLQEAQTIINLFLDQNYKELDTARSYGNGTSEEYLSQLELRNATVDTKCFPASPGGHAPEELRSALKASLAALHRDKVRVFYLHAPDRATPFEDTLREIDALHTQGLFEIFGLSNFASWEVAEIVATCKANKWVQPKIYQAMYNGITRAIESELVPCLRKNGIRLVIYNPLAGGFFAGKITSPTDAGPKGGRFDDSSKQGAMYRARYINDTYVKSLEGLKSVAVKYNLRLTEIALRWVQHHSVLGPDDGVILGASSAEQLEQNIGDSEKGPLPEEVVAAVDQAWANVGMACPPYWRPF